MIKLWVDDLQLYHLINQFDIEEQIIKKHLFQMGITNYSCIPFLLRLPSIKGDPPIDEEQLELKAGAIIEHIRLNAQKRKLYVAIDGDCTQLKFLFFSIKNPIQLEEFYQSVRNIIEEAKPNYYIKMALSKNCIIDDMTALSGILYKLATFHEKYSPSTSFSSVSHLEDQIMRSLKERQFVLAKEQTDQLLDLIKQNYSGERAKLEILGFYAAIKRRLNKLGADMVLPSSDDMLLGLFCYNDAYELFHELYVYAGSKKDRNNRKLIFFQKKVNNFVEENYTREITLVEVAKHIGFSEFYFSKLMKMAFHVSFIDYLATLRIERAQILLETTEKSITYISKAVGYENPNYFARLFKKKTGKSPRQYRYDSRAI